MSQSRKPSTTQLERREEKIEALRASDPAARLKRAIELSDLAKKLADSCSSKPS